MEGLSGVQNHASCYQKTPNQRRHGWFSGVRVVQLHGNENQLTTSEFSFFLPTT
jgi:hypothetical protein